MFLQYPAFAVGAQGFGAVTHDCVFTNYFNIVTKQNDFTF